MDNRVEFDVEGLKLLESPKDITEAIEDLSRKHSGQVMVHLVSNNPNVKREESEIWFNPRFMQEERDNSRSAGNTRVKFFMEVQQNELRIDTVQPLEVNNSGPFPFSDALERFGQEQGFAHRDFDYAGRMVAKKES